MKPVLDLQCSVRFTVEQNGGEIWTLEGYINRSRRELITVYAAVPEAIMCFSHDRSIIL